MKNQHRTAAKRGSVERPAIERVWGSFSPRLGRFIRARVADAPAAEDILQDMFVKLLEHFDEIQDPAKIEGWLYLAARNAVIDHYRTRKPASELPEMLPVEMSATESIEIEELHSRLRQIIERLPQEYREAFVLTTFGGFSQGELATHLGISLSGAKSRVQRARERLKEMLLEFCRQEFSWTPGCQPCPRGLFPVASTENSAKKRKPGRQPGQSKQTISSKGKSHVSILPPG